MCFFYYVGVGFIRESLIFALKLATGTYALLLVIPINYVTWGDITVYFDSSQADNTA